MKTLIIYHGDCYDGFSAAWVAKRAMPDAELYPARYGDLPPEVSGYDRVFILDFSYPRAMMINMATWTRLKVLDHHKTAQADCEGLDFCEFDMERSGCAMTWRFFYPNEATPDWLLRVEDRDLWRFKYDDTRFCHAFIASLPMTLASWDELAAMRHSEIASSGTAISRYIDTYLRKAAQEARVVTLSLGDGWQWRPIVLNIPYQNASEAADVLLDLRPDADFSIGYFQRADGRWQYSLRSRGNGPDVSEIAKVWGGGGHEHAAGFDTATLIL